MNNDPRRRLSRPEVPGISAIFNPRKLRRNSTAVTSQLLGATGRHPSVVVTDDNLEVEFGLGPSSSSMIASMVNGPHGTGGGGVGVGGGGTISGGGVCAVNIGSSQGSSVPLLSESAQLQGANNSIVTIESTLINSSSQQLQRGQDPNSANNNNTNLKPIAKTIATIRRALFSKTARKLCCGLFLSILVGCCWTIMFHSIKRVYVTMHLFPDDFSMPPYSPFQPNSLSQAPSSSPVGGGSPSSSASLSDSAYQVTPYTFPGYDSSRVFQPLDPDTMTNNNNDNTNSDAFNSDVSGSSLAGNSSLMKGDGSGSSMPKTMSMVKVYDAPFFTAWVLTICTVFFYPIHQLTVRFCSCMGRKGPKSMSRAVSDAIQGFRERGMTLFQFIGRCTTLCCLWVLTNWLIAYSLKTLKATEVLALFATTTSFLYLLSWVVLHQQFVGLRILAVILSNMGIALFAYMDGQTYRSKTITGVMVGATAAGTSAVFKVSLKKSFGFGATISQQVALIFSVVGIISIVVLWPVFLLLYFTGIEVIIWSYVPWELILFAVTSFLLVAMLDNFGVTCTFEFFITIGLLMAIPFSAVLDVHLYKVSFDGMCLAGIIVIGIGFCIVLLPENWPDYITRLIRRFHGPTEEEKPHELPSRDSAMPRLSRAGLENHFVNPTPPPAGAYSPAGSNSISVSSAHSLTHTTVTQQQQQQHHHHPSPHQNNLNNQYTTTTATTTHHTNTNHTTLFH